MSNITGIDLNKSALQIAACDTGRSRAACDHSTVGALDSAVSLDTVSHFTLNDEKIDLCVLLDGYDPGPAIGSAQTEFHALEARFAESIIDIGVELDVCPAATGIREIVFVDSTVTDIDALLGGLRLDVEV